MSGRPRLLLVQPSLQPPGGGNGVAVWLVEALRDEYAITVVAWDPVDVASINDYWGTSLRSADLEVRLVARALYWLRKVSRLRLALLQRYVTIRHARRIIGAFDLAISVNNEIDAGRRAVQYIHFPWGFWPRPDADLRWFHRIPGVLRLYYRLGAALAPASPQRIAANRTLVNSEWTGVRFRERYGGETETVYPPVIGSPYARQWSGRENAFVILGVLGPHKRIETALAILDRVRAAGHSVTLHVVGSRGDRLYLRKIRQMIDARPWARLHLDVPRDALLQLLGSVRFGLHAMPDEHFGVAIAEMVRSGCIVFVPNDGGQVEIVDRDPRLTYDSAGDAVAKILRVLGDPVLQEELQHLLSKHAKQFSYERFRDQIRAIVAEEIASGISSQFSVLSSQ